MNFHFFICESSSSFLISFNLLKRIAGVFSFIQVSYLTVKKLLDVDVMLFFNYSVKFSKFWYRIVIFLHKMLKNYAETVILSCFQFRWRTIYRWKYLQPQRSALFFSLSNNFRKKINFSESCFFEEKRLFFAKRWHTTFVRKN